MSSDIYSKPDLSHKVRYNRRAEEYRTECIYEGTYDMVGSHNIFQPQEEERHQNQIQNQPAVKKQAVRSATLCKTVLCIVAIAVILILNIYLTVDLNKLKYSYNQQLQELLANNTQLQRSHNQLTDDLKQLKNMTEANNSQLQSSYEMLSKNYSLLKDEVKELKDTIKGKCPDQWKRFGCSCYFKSTQWKSWSESRKDCQERGADLVIINTEEEQTFVAELSMNGESWIGLMGQWIQWKSDYQWQWVDGSPLTQSFWETRWPKTYSNWQYATMFQGKWKNSYNSNTKNWICEK
ncbi:CD209 antigen-like protein C [Kryptolebias marmoratus]|uniref:CD209 antigen-like protein C n=1 Tax=Kryptolebias marmoratus TaxID=37003 RepID=UPI0007F8B223|nr:CD209 antigen-like protein C [Kryptolebias marmoratus]